MVNMDLPSNPYETPAQDADNLLHQMIEVRDHWRSGTSQPIGERLENAGNEILDDFKKDITDLYTGAEEGVLDTFEHTVNTVDEFGNLITGSSTVKRNSDFLYASTNRTKKARIYRHGPNKAYYSFHKRRRWPYYLSKYGRRRRRLN